MENTPSQTLYINNINEKIKKNVLKKVLHSLCSQYGKVIEIVACKGLKLRGQAWVVYQDSGSATNAMRRLQGFNLYDKPMVSELYMCVSSYLKQLAVSLTVVLVKYFLLTATMSL